MEFLVAGASAVQIGTATFYDPTACMRIADALPGVVNQLGCQSVREAIAAMHK
jgi:dihydroorotate dehydrogenase (NAD+) catalytic subunit